MPGGCPKALSMPAPRSKAPRPGFSALPTYASCGSIAAGPSWAWWALCRSAVHRPGPRQARPGCAVTLGPCRAGGRCSEHEPRVGGWRAEGAGLRAAAGEAPGRTCCHPCWGQGAVRRSGAEDRSRVSGCSQSVHNRDSTQLSTLPRPSSEARPFTNHPSTARRIQA